MKTKNEKNNIIENMFNMLMLHFEGWGLFKFLQGSFQGL